MIVAYPVTTAEELLTLTDDGYRYELVRGELRKMAPSGEEHGRVAAHVIGQLYFHVVRESLGDVYTAETGFLLSRNPDTVRAPDLAFIVQERREAPRAALGYCPIAPDLAVEVVSPGDHAAEVEEKVLQWLDAGTRMVVVIWPRTRTVTVYRSRDQIRILGEGDVLSGKDVVPGWELPLAQIFT